jgi:hypothetical protein
MSQKLVYQSRSVVGLALIENKGPRAGRRGGYRWPRKICLSHRRYTRPAATPYYIVVKGVSDAGDTAAAFQWFKRLLELDVVHNMDTFDRKKTT